MERVQIDHKKFVKKKKELSPDENKEEILKIIKSLYELVGEDENSYHPTTAHDFYADDADIWRNEHAFFQFKSFTRMSRGLLSQDFG